MCYTASIETICDFVMQRSRRLILFYSVFCVNVLKTSSRLWLSLCKETMLRLFCKEISRICFLTAFEIHESEFNKLFPEMNARFFLRKPTTIRALNSKINEMVNQSLFEKRQDRWIFRSCSKCLVRSPPF